MALGRAILALSALAAAGEQDFQSMVEDLAKKVKVKPSPGGMGDPMKGLGGLGGGGGLEGLGGLMNMLGGLTDKLPDFECQPGEAVAPKMDHHEAMSANGCGPQGLPIKEDFGLHVCCNGHDVCFSVCGASHNYCEKEFARCMKKICKNPLSGSRKECKAQAKTFTTLTASLGKAFHSKSQSESCECIKEEEVPGRHRAYLQSFLQRFNESAASDELIDAALERWKGREGELYFDLVKTYGKEFVRFDDVEAKFHRDEL